MGSRVNQLVFFEIFFFIIYLVICSIPGYVLERHLKVLLIFSSLSFSIIFSAIAIIFMLIKREIFYVRTIIACVPILYLLAIFTWVKIQ
jgi:hypothetical protein